MQGGWRERKKSLCKREYELDRENKQAKKQRKASEICLRKKYSKSKP